MTNLTAQLEALLFVAGEPVSVQRLSATTDQSSSEVIAALQELATALKGSGISLTHHYGAYRLVTAPEQSELIRKFLSDDAKTDLTKPALEALAIVAYRGPLTKSALDEVRGVSSDATLRNLLQRGLIVEHGTADEPGKPTLYAVSQAFLQEFGFSSLEELPPLEETDPQ